MSTDPSATTAGADAPVVPHPSTHTVEEVIRHRLATVLGGWRGSLETALPTVAFVVAWVARGELRTAVVAALVVTGVLAVVRVAQRQSLKYVLQAVVPTVIAAWFALRSGRAEDAFLPGIICFMVAAGDPDLGDDPMGWRRDRGLVRVCTRLTLVLIAVFAIRLLVMVPLYLAEQVAALGVAKIVLGWPIWLAGLTVMGLLLLRGRTPSEWEPQPSEGSGSDADPGAPGTSA